MKTLQRALLWVTVIINLTGCGSIVSRTFNGQGVGHQYYPGVMWDIRESGWRFLKMIDLPFSFLVDTVMLPIDRQHGRYY